MEKLNGPARHGYQADVPFLGRVSGTTRLPVGPCRAVRLGNYTLNTCLEESKRIGFKGLKSYWYLRLNNKGILISSITCLSNISGSTGSTIAEECAILSRDPTTCLC
jgi:hypothetical protein